MKNIRIALLDMNNNVANQGMRNIRELTEEFVENSSYSAEYEEFEIRSKGEFPDLALFDIFVSSGGPGSPHPEGLEWESKFNNLLDGIWNHNLTHQRKKYLFLICHSFQLAAIHWNIGTVNLRKSYSFGIMPIHKTEAGKNHPCIENLKDPFYAVDSRAYQLIQPNRKRLKEVGIKILALEKFRPHVKLERAVMALQFSNEIVGTQFHPEADPDGLKDHFLQEERKKQLIELYGEDKYYNTLDHLDDEDKIPATQQNFLPKFFEIAAQTLTPIPVNL